MAVTLGNLPSNAPLKTGAGYRQLGGTGGSAPLWPPAGWHMQGGSGENAETPTFRSSQRFMLNVGASMIVAIAGQTWTTYYYQLRLLINYAAYGNDLNGVGLYTKANSWLGMDDPWFGLSMEGLFYCEANTDYVVRFLSAGSSQPNNTNYYNHATYWNMWAHTIGEGAY